MKKCAYCRHESPNDSIYCVHCGKKLEIKQDKKIVHKKNPRKNYFGILGIFLFLIALIGLDFIIASVISSLGMDATFVFIISLVIYCLAISSGLFSIILDFRDKKKGYEQTGNIGFSIAAIFLSFYIGLINLSGVILK